MKFAVVEYTSKSGTIWRHSLQVPNYLADPDKEIDPTSFGCYVSALEGEHIPLKGLILGPVNSVSNSTIQLRKVIKRLTKHWPTGYDISYLATFDVLMVVHQISNAHEMTGLIKKLRRLPNRPLIIGVPTQPFGLLEAAWKQTPQILQEVKDFIEQCDVFLTVVKTTLPTWQSLTTTPTIYVPQPYPVDYVRSLNLTNNPKKPILFVAGITDRPNIALGQQAAVAIQKRFPEYEIHITDTPGMAQNTDNLASAKYEVQPFLPWQKQLAYLQQVKLVINTDFTSTRGRVQVDCAAVGTPSLGSDSDGQYDVFPTLAATPTTTLDQLVAMASRLLTDDAHYSHVTAEATMRLQKLNYIESADRIRLLVKTHPKREVCQEVKI